jgi:disulfide bond formation protein DsbB
LGPALTTSEFVAGLTDDGLVAFLIVGRPDTDPANTTGIAMPPRGGNTSLTDDDLRAVVAYLRTLQIP